jgi:acyl-CoA synthetase (NDP forming)
MTVYSDLQKAFNPKTVAIVGVSSTNELHRDYSGLKFLQNLKGAGFKGRIYPINPKATNDIEGMKVYPSLLSVPEHLDLVIITVKAEAVPKVLEDCVAIKAMDVHICTSGFGETGEVEGKVLETRMREIARSAGLRVCGPNSIGYHVPSAGMKMYEGPMTSGTVALATQSGGCGQFFILQCSVRGIGISKIISFGNALTLGAPDYLEYLAKDPQTDVICMYLEGMNDGRRFTELVRQTNRQKPVIIWKGGINESGARAVSTHTGSLAGDMRIWDAFFRQTKAIRVDSLEEMADIAMTFVRMKPFKVRRAAVFGAGGGGANVVRGDICTSEGIDVPALSLDTRKKLMEYIPLVNQSVMNPMDTPFLLYNSVDLDRTLKLLAADPVIDILIMHASAGTLYEMSQGTGKAFSEFKECIIRFNEEDRSGKPLVVALMDPSCRGGLQEYATKLRGADITVYDSLRDACRALYRFTRYNEFIAETS